MGVVFVLTSGVIAISQDTIHDEMLVVSAADSLDGLKLPEIQCKWQAKIGIENIEARQFPQSQTSSAPEEQAAIIRQTIAPRALRYRSRGDEPLDRWPMLAVLDRPRAKTFPGAPFRRLTTNPTKGMTRAGDPL